MTLTPAQNGFIKGLALFVVASLAAYLADPSHLTVFSAGTAAVVAALASSLESFIKAQSGLGLFGAVKVAQR